MLIDDFAAVALECHADGQLLQSALEVTIALARADGGAIVVRQGDERLELATSGEPIGSLTTCDRVLGSPSEPASLEDRRMVPFMRLEIGGDVAGVAELYLVGLRLSPNVSPALGRSLGIVASLVSSCSGESRGCLPGAAATRPLSAGPRDPETPAVHRVNR